MKQRGVSKKDSASLKSSFDRSKAMQVRHAKKGEQFTVTHGNKNPSGIYVSKRSLGRTPAQRMTSEQRQAMFSLTAVQRLKRRAALLLHTIRTELMKRKSPNM